MSLMTPAEATALHACASADDGGRMEELNDDHQNNSIMLYTDL